jgi:hypothetical protein
MRTPQLWTGQHPDGPTRSFASCAVVGASGPANIGRGIRRRNSSWSYRIRSANHRASHHNVILRYFTHFSLFIVLRPILFTPPPPILVTLLFRGNTCRGLVRPTLFKQGCTKNIKSHWTSSPQLEHGTFPEASWLVCVIALRSPSVLHRRETSFHHGSQGKCSLSSRGRRTRPLSNKLPAQRPVPV